jgi:hypothetical protein
MRFSRPIQPKRVWMPKKRPAGDPAGPFTLEQI